MRGLPETGTEHINHFHAGGTCADDRAGSVVPATSPLETIVAKGDGTGSGTTTLKNVTLDSLFAPDKKRYVALHSEGEKGQGIPPVISCADVVEAAVSGTVSTNPPETGEPHLVVLLSILTFSALGAVVGLVVLERRFA